MNETHAQATQEIRRLLSQNMDPHPDLVNGLLELADGLSADLERAQGDQTEARRELDESRRIWKEKRDELQAFCDRAVAASAPLQQALEALQVDFETLKAKYKSLLEQHGALAMRVKTATEGLGEEIDSLATRRDLDVGRCVLVLAKVMLWKK